MNAPQNQGFVDRLVDSGLLDLDRVVIPKTQYIKINGVKAVCYSDSGQALHDYTHLKNMFPGKNIELVGE